jgi:hypothetical protein
MRDQRLVSSTYPGDFVVESKARNRGQSTAPTPASRHWPEATLATYASSLTSSCQPPARRQKKSPVLGELGLIWDLVAFKIS